MSDEQTRFQEELQQLAEKYPGKDEYQIYLIDNVERLLTNSRDQTKYLKNISTILTVAVILVVLGWLVTFIFG